MKSPLERQKTHLCTSCTTSQQQTQSEEEKETKKDWLVAIDCRKNEIKIKSVSHLVLLLEAVALSTFHLGDVLKQICHTDGRVKLPCLVGHIHCLPFLKGMSVGLNQAAGLTGHGVVLICSRSEKQGARGNWLGLK